MNTSGSLRLCVAICGATSVFFALPASAQRRWQTEVRLATELRYDDNPFLLTAGRKTRLDQPSADDVISGQFLDMESASDVVPVPELRVAFEGPGLGGRRLTIATDLAYDFNVQNGRRRHAELDLTVEQSVASGSRVALAAGFRPGYFSKNYLADAFDGNVDGTITPDERRYAPGTSDELTVGLVWRQRLVRRGGGRRVGVEGSLSAGYATRSFDAPFAGRTRRGPTGAAGLRFDLGRRWSVDVDYELAIENAEVTREVSLLDEPVFAQDFNGNGTTTDLEARAFELVDRSRTEHLVEVGMQVEVSRRVDLEVSYDRRMRVYGSGEAFDVSHRNRRDALNEFAAEMAVRLARGVQLTLGAQYGSQDTNRAGDPGSTGEVTDYTRTQVSAGLRYRF